VTGDRLDRAIDALAAVADHRYTLIAGWLSPALVFALPEEYQGAALAVLLGTFVVLHQAQLSRGP